MTPKKSNQNFQRSRYDLTIATSYKVNMNNISEKNKWSKKNIEKVIKENYNLKNSVYISFGDDIFQIFVSNDSVYKYFSNDWLLVEKPQSKSIVSKIYIFDNIIDINKIINFDADENITDDDYLIATKTEEMIWFATDKKGTIGISIIEYRYDHEIYTTMYEFIRGQLLIHIGVYYENNGKYLIHASAVHRDNNAMILMGKKFSGKSTQTAILMNLGWDFISDDKVFISLKDDIVYVERCSLSIKFRKESKKIMSISNILNNAKINDNWNHPIYGEEFRYSFANKDSNNKYKICSIAYMLNGNYDIDKKEYYKIFIDSVMFNNPFKSVGNKNKILFFNILNKLFDKINIITFDYKKDNIDKLCNIENMNNLH